MAIVFHTECLGAWVKFWQRCAQEVEAFEVVELSWGYYSERVFKQPVLRKHEMCGLRVHAKPHSCADAVMEQISVLLETKYVWDALIIPAGRLLLSLPDKHAASCVLLAYVWFITILLAPFIPTFLPLSALLAKVHIETVSQQMVHDSAACMPRGGFNIAVLLVLLWQYCVASGTF
eukprot:155184-Amphidinium_carterae.1